MSRRRFACASVGLITVAACSAPSTIPDQDSTSKANGAAYQPMTIDNCGYQVSFEEPPSRVLLMQGASVGEAETFIELGLDDTIIASAQDYGVSDIDGMAAKVDALPDDGLTLNDAYDVPAEQVLSLQPDLVISTWSGGFNEEFGFASRETLHDAGIKTLVNPVNCAYGKTGTVTEAEQSAYENATTLASLDFITLIGDIFNVPDRADDVVDELQGELQTTVDQVGEESPKRMMIAFPSMAAMNVNSLPAVFSGGFYDSLLTAAGGVNVFPDDPGITMTLSGEQLAAANVEVLVLGAWRAEDDLDAAAADLFAAYPQWPASKTKTWVGVSDGVYLGPANAQAIEKIAKVAHPDAVQ